MSVLIPNIKEGLDLSTLKFADYDPILGKVIIGGKEDAKVRKQIKKETRKR